MTHSTPLQVCLALVLATGCPQPADTGLPDLDGDGYSIDLDCDDSEPSVNPNASEVCDGVDNDCDAEVDEFVLGRWYSDADGDGYGDPGSEIGACTQPAGTVADATDCDDGDASIHPDAVELCNGIDDDCDDAVDDDPAGGSDWYADADQDGFGDPGAWQMACEQPAGHVGLELASDCDDSDAAINVDADEICDGADNDCDGVADEDEALDAATWFLDGDGDGYGLEHATTGACAQPAGYAPAAGDCDDADGEVHPGAQEYCDERDQDCDGQADDSDALDATSWYSDADGDGFGDADTELVQCWESGDLVADSSDCDDTDAQVSPAADEICDTIDNDCDGTADEDDAIDAASWYLDADGDEYGDETVSSTSCEQPAGYTGEPGDCDDADGLAYPEAVEFCGDAVDNDCDGADSSCPAPGDLIITEIMVDPAALGDSDGEYFELYNTSGDSIDLQGLVVYDYDVQSFLIDEPLEVEPGAFLLLARASTATEAYDWVWPGFVLANGMDEVGIATWGSDGTDGEVIHEVFYDEVDWPVTAGASLSLSPDAFNATDAMDAAHWCPAQSAFETGDLGTPGEPNDDCL